MQFFEGSFWVESRSTRASWMLTSVTGRPLSRPQLFEAQSNSKTKYLSALHTPNHVLTFRLKFGVQRLSEAPQWVLATSVDFWPLKHHYPSKGCTRMLRAFGRCSNKSGPLTRSLLRNLYPFAVFACTWFPSRCFSEEQHSYTLLPVPWNQICFWDLVLLTKCLRVQMSSKVTAARGTDRYLLPSDNTGLAPSPDSLYLWSHQLMIE